MASIIKSLIFTIWLWRASFVVDFYIIEAQQESLLFKPLLTVSSFKNDSHNTNMITILTDETLSSFIAHVNYNSWTKAI